jgi:hypothetical protein
MSIARQQKLVDICFEIGLLVNDPKYRSKFRKLSQEELAQYVADQLNKCGFPTQPLGLSWGILDPDSESSQVEIHRLKAELEKAKDQIYTGFPTKS